MKAHEIFWNEDTWSINPPENWEEICAVANALIVEHLNENNIIPKAFDPRVGPAVAKAVAEAARKCGVARI